MDRVAEVTVRRMVESDLPDVARIQAASPSAAQWPAADYLQHLTWVAESGNCVRGFLVLLDASGEDYELLTLAVEPLWRRRGIARRLLATALKQWPGRYFLEVRESNWVARQFYMAQGFSEVGKRPAYYADPVENAIVMQHQQ